MDRLKSLLGVGREFNLESGLYHEHVLREVLKDHLTSIFSVKTGYVKEEWGVSGQQDILVLDERIANGYLMKYGQFAVVRPQMARASVQTKTSLNSVAEFTSAIRNLITLKQLYITPATFGGPISGIVCFRRQSDTSEEFLHKVFAEFTKNEGQHMPDFLYVQSDGLLLMRKQEEDEFIYRALITGKEQNDAAWQLSVIISLILDVCEGPSSALDHVMRVVRNLDGKWGVTAYKLTKPE